MGKNDVNQIADNVRVVHAGCGVNALSGLQNFANSIYCNLRVGLISVAHQAILCLSYVKKGDLATALFLLNVFTRFSNSQFPAPVVRGLIAQSQFASLSRSVLRRGRTG